MKKTARFAAVAAVAALALAGCGSKPSSTASDNPSTPTSSSPGMTTTANNPNFKGCQVSDSGGFDDKSFNQTSLKGLMDAATDFKIKTAKVQSASDSEYAKNIASMVAAKCNIITTVGFLLGDATLAAAKANPNIDFAIVDYAYFDDKGNNTAPKNLKGLTFDTAQPSYLAGYLAAAYSKTGAVGTFGGLPIPTVTSFMEGFKEGVDKYNQDSGKSVKVLGWDGKNGAFVGGFDDKSKGQSIANGFIQQGADVVFPVAGPAGLGGLQAAKDNNVKGIWVDTDGCVSAAEYCSVLLTSVMKGMDVAVETAVKDSLEGNFDNAPYNGTLENGGVGLAPLAADVPADVKSKLDELKQGIIDGSIKVGS